MGDTMIFLTTDGSDSCMPKDDYCGLVAPNLASLMLEVSILNASESQLVYIDFIVVCVVVFVVCV